MAVYPKPLEKAGKTTTGSEIEAAARTSEDRSIDTRSFKIKMGRAMKKKKIFFSHMMMPYRRHSDHMCTDDQASHPIIAIALGVSGRLSGVQALQRIDNDTIHLTLNV